MSSTTTISTTITTTTAITTSSTTTQLITVPRSRQMVCKDDGVAVSSWVPSYRSPTKSGAYGKKKWELTDV